MRWYPCILIFNGGAFPEIAVLPSGSRIWSGIIPVVHDFQYYRTPFKRTVQSGYVLQRPLYPYCCNHNCFKLYCKKCCPHHLEISDDPVSPGCLNGIVRDRWDVGFGIFSDLWHIISAVSASTVKISIKIVFQVL